MSAVLFGSISTVADTSELQRHAFNSAFEAHGLQWHWEGDAYRDLLDKSGGESRIASFARSRGETVDAPAVHQTKSQLFQESLAAADLKPRPGVVDTIRSAKNDGVQLGLVTTTSHENVAALLLALSPQLTADDFDIIVDSSSVDRAKPDSAAYSFALRSLQLDAVDCVAVEDNVEGVLAATRADLTCVAFPNENTARQEFGQARQTVDRLDFAELRELIGHA